MTTNARAYVVVVNYRGWSDTIECLESLLRLSYSNYSVIVVDNGSRNDSIGMIKQWAKGDLQIETTNSPMEYLISPRVQKPFPYVMYDRILAEQGGDTKLESDTFTFVGSPDLVIIDSNDNLGFAGGNNVALRYIKQKGDHDYVWLLNNDTIVDPESLTQLIKRMKQIPDAGICGSTIRYYSAPNVVQVYGGGVYNPWLGWNHHLDEQYMSTRNIAKSDIDSTMSYVSGASMLVSRKFLESVGELCEDYFLYFEELDWAWRRKDNFKITWAPDCDVYHKGGSSIKSDKQKNGLSIVSEYYIQRNKIIFTRKFIPWALPTIYFGLAMAIIKRMVNRQWYSALLLVKIALFFRKPQGIPGRAN